MLLQKGHQDRDQQDVVPQGWGHGWLWFPGSTGFGEHRLQGRPEWIGSAVLVGLGQPAPYLPSTKSRRSGALICVKLRLNWP